MDHPNPSRWRRVKVLVAVPVLFHIDHFACHPAIDNKDPTRDKRRLVRQQKGCERRDIFGLSDPTHGMLGVVDRTQIKERSTIALFPGPHVHPARSNTVHPDIRTQTDGEGMGKRNQAAFCRRIGLRIRLGLKRTSRGDSDHRPATLPQVRRDPF